MKWKKIILLALITLFSSCNSSQKGENKDAKFIFSSWTNAGKNFTEEAWTKRLNYYDSLGISEILIGGSPEVLEKIIPLATKKNIKMEV